MTLRCDICEKDYSSYKTLWYHNKTKHGDNMDNDAKNEQNVNIIHKCEFCSKEYKTRQSKSRHKKLCNKKTSTNKIEEINDIINNLQNKISHLEQNNTKNIININNGTINNTNQIIINRIGEENPFDLKYNEIQKILSQEIQSIISFIEYLNFNEQLPSNHNFLTSSLESNYLTIYNSDDNTFEKQRKKYVFDEIMSSSINKIEKLYDTFKTDFTFEKQLEIRNNINNLKQIHLSGYNNKILKELNKQINLLSYNKKHIIEKTWNRLKNQPIDEEEDKQYWLEIANETKLELAIQNSEPDNTNNNFNKLDKSNNFNKLDKSNNFNKLDKYKSKNASFFTDNNSDSEIEL
jgi:hypothetical protein